jgi:hypothetical protein
MWKGEGGPGKERGNTAGASAAVRQKNVLTCNVLTDNVRYCKVRSCNCCRGQFTRWGQRGRPSESGRAPRRRWELPGAADSGVSACLLPSAD